LVGKKSTVQSLTPTSLKATGLRGKTSTQSETGQFTTGTIRQNKNHQDQ
jgi:hypothetical protein